MKQSHRLTAALCATLIASCVLPAILRAQQQAVASRASAMPLLALSGSDSKITTPSYRLISSQSEWEQLWRRHTGKPSTGGYIEDGMPKVNFDKCMLVAVFNHPANNLGVFAESLDEQSDRIVLRINNRWFSTITRLGHPAPKPKNPYGFFVLPRSGKEVVVEEAVYQRKSDPPTYQERVRLRH
jgi:hypothetical protein